MISHAYISNHQTTAPKVHSESSWWFQPICKMLVKMGIISPGRDETKKSLKPPPTHE